MEVIGHEGGGSRSRAEGGEQRRPRSGRDSAPKTRKNAHRRAIRARNPRRVAHRGAAFTPGLEHGDQRGDAAKESWKLAPSKASGSNAKTKNAAQARLRIDKAGRLNNTATSITNVITNARSAPTREPVPRS